jgi:hypothetical protein
MVRGAFSVSAAETLLWLILPLMQAEAASSRRTSRAKRDFITHKKRA